MESILAIATIALLNIALYWPTLFYTVIIDDIHWYKSLENEKFTIKNFFLNIRKRFYGGGTFGLNTIIDHAFGIFLHTLSCVLMFFAFGQTQVAFWSAILYACHPSLTQTSIWLNGRRYMVNIIFVLLMMIVVPKEHFGVGALGLGFYFLTPLMQFTAILSPILLGARDFGWLYLAIIPIALLVGGKEFISRYKKRMATIHSSDMREFKPKRLIIITKTFGFYTLNMLFPRRNLMVYSFLARWGLDEDGNKNAYRIDGYFLAGVLSLGAVLAGCFLLKGELLCYLVFAFLATLQWSNIFTAVQNVADRYISLPCVFVMFLVSHLAVNFLGAFAIPALFALAVYYATKLKVVMEMYKDIYAYYKYQLFHEPENTGVRRIQINWFMKTGDPMGAWILCREGLKLTPNDFTMNYQAAMCCQIMGDIKMSRHYLNVAKENYYINQKEVWQNNINILEVNLKALDERPNHQRKAGLVNFARNKR